MTDRLNFSSFGHSIEAEQITVPNQAPYKVRLKHHYVKKETPSSVEIWQNQDKTGAFLIEEAYTGSVSANGYFQVDYEGREDGDVKYCNTLLFHSGQAGMTWYVWYKSQGDVVDAESLNSKADKVPGAVAGNFASLDATGNLQDSGKNTDDFAPATHVTDATKHIQEALTGKAGYVVAVNDTETGLELRRISVLTFDAGLPGW
ncbi:hypothetical protein [Atrimonas thermophila]|uniref:hypothetical protein n=1 Tax=Atrimonas thermophila TaxID=3064161 RepID=UPI00399C8E14